MDILTWVVTDDAICAKPFGFVFLYRLHEYHKHGNEETRKEKIIHDVEDGDFDCKEKKRVTGHFKNLKSYSC